LKILLDECLPIGFRHSFVAHEAHTAEWAGFKGLKNGELLQAAVKAGYEVLITVDHGIPQQLSAATSGLAVILMRSRTNQLEDLLPLADEILRGLGSIRPGEIVSIPD
jgi:hypothetical protein